MQTNTPLVSGAAIRQEGQILTALPGGRPCYQCIYPETLENQETCAMEGVLAPLVGVIGSMQAMQAVQVLAGNGEPLRGLLLLFDGAQMRHLILTPDHFTRPAEVVTTQEVRHLAALPRLQAGQ